MKNLLLLATVVLSTIIYSCNCKSCSKLTAVSEATQIAGEWSFITINGDSVNNEKAFIAFIENKVSGNTGCNSFTGDITLSKGEIEFGTIASTRKMCMDISFEETLFSLIGNNKWAATFNKEIIVLTKEDNKIELKRKK